MRRPLVLLIDALAARFGGTTYTVVQLVAALVRRDDVAAVHVVAQESSLVARELRPVGTVKLHALRAPGHGELPWRLAWESTRLPGLAQRLGADAVVSASGIVPRDPRCPVISLLLNPVPFVDRRRPANRLRRWAIVRTSRHAAAVLVPSSEMARRVGDGPKVTIVPLGVDRDRFRPADGAGRDLVCVADFYSHKRHDLLLEAWARLPSPRPSLRLIGNPAVSPQTFERVQAAAAGQPGVVVEGRVSLDRLVRAYQEARALVIASERESFCMPVAEALSCGTPAVLRDAPVLRETGGPGALYVKGDDSRDWASALENLCSDDTLHRTLRERGLVHCRRYSWDRMAAAVVERANQQP